MCVRTAVPDSRELRVAASIYSERPIQTFVLTTRRSAGCTGRDEAIELAGCVPQSPGVAVEVLGITDL